MKSSIAMELAQLVISSFSSVNLLNNLVVPLFDGKKVMILLPHQVIACIVYDEYLYKLGKQYNGMWC